MRKLRIARQAVLRRQAGPAVQVVPQDRASRVRDAPRSVPEERQIARNETVLIEVVPAMQAETAAIRPEIALVTRVRTVQEMAETAPATQAETGPEMQAETGPEMQAETGPEMSAEIAVAETLLADARVRVCARRQVGPCRFEAVVRRAFGPMGRFARSTVTACRFGQTFTADARS
jgi:hypothetical protein